MVNPDHVQLAFSDRFGTAEGVRLFRAPGRVNLIGEHTDYNDGFVLPCAIDRDTVVAARPRTDSVISAYSINLHKEGSFDLGQPAEIRKGYWLNYVEGTARVLRRMGFTIGGADIVLESDVPVGAGLSSSASLEMSVATALVRLGGQPMDRKRMALACQEGEHEFTGAMIGIMDQFISAFGEAESALLLDCRSLETTAIPVDLEQYALLICDTGVKHNLAASAYNDRREECRQAVACLSVEIPGIRALRDVTMEQLAAYASRLSPLLLKRARHVVAENARTLAAAQALLDGNYEELSKLMYASHESLRKDYEVSAPELDLLVETSHMVPGVFGMRMTGGGFGGCTVSFVTPDRVEEFTYRMQAAYEKGFGRNLSIYNVKIVRGAEETT
jgi:galactokinase